MNTLVAAILADAPAAAQRAALREWAAWFLVLVLALGVGVVVMLVVARRSVGASAPRRGRAGDVRPAADAWLEAGRRLDPDDRPGERA